ncbi:hypothetical protein ASF24_15675 [Methylobacterium sp. Leaf86]|uniref:hypothetical protein n=1 Tax=Methylobacterium sp. Leaf86 TaxID=1736242 RepID=UPI000700C982|nr:hypothetical protein [Methylobacterium sp. Leaf86]KQO58077.1 hypothetical protein ASF24_15675 [Methylobacterium sp. Leaf86]
MTRPALASILPGVTWFEQATLRDMVRSGGGVVRGGGQSTPVMEGLARRDLVSPARVRGFPGWTITDFGRRAAR